MFGAAELQLGHGSLQEGDSILLRKNSTRISGIDGSFHDLLAQDCEHTLSSTQCILSLGKYSTNAWLQCDGSSPFSHLIFSVSSEAGGEEGLVVSFALRTKGVMKDPVLGRNSCL